MPALDPGNPGWGQSLSAYWEGKVLHEGESCSTSFLSAGAAGTSAAVGSHVV